MKMNRTVAGFTAAAMLAVSATVPAHAEPTNVTVNSENARPPAFAGYVPPAVVNVPTTLQATTTAGTQGEIRFMLEDGTVLGSAPVNPEGTAELKHTFTRTGQHKVKAAVVTNGIIGDYTELFTVTVVRPGSSTRIDVASELDTASLAAAALGVAASLVVLIGSHSNIPAINATITQVQKQLGIWNQDLAAQVQQAMPAVGTLVGGAGLIASIVQLTEVLKAGNLTVTSSKEAV
ncbi:hypothetical protein [Corynebacterium urinipleomorphum]|uniref:hypothetical protein n=1 Tax=Corynebacterium urinipleomorphum TaxID=1852380 RepID=UPI001177AC3A|nr:hypothetical protein [Corynebacterium urinipleomorphum]